MLIMQAILCFGDSITFGKGESPHTGWVGRLKAYFEPQSEHNEVHNLGIPGNTSTDLLKRFDIESSSRIRVRGYESKYLILLAIGCNDSKWNGAPEDNNPVTIEADYEKNIRELIKIAHSYKEKVREHKTEVAFIGLIPVDETLTLPFEETSFQNSRVKLFNAIAKKVCKENNVSFLELFEPFSAENYPLLLQDGLHPNTKGFDFMFSKIKPFLENNKLI